MSQFPISGVYAAATTALDPDLAPNPAAHAAHVAWLLAQGCDGVAPLGTTGEAMSFSVAERQRILEDLLAAGTPPDRILLGTGAASITDSTALTQHALAHGVHTVLVLPPFYYKGMSDDGLYAAYAQLINGVADDRLRIMLYHIPHISGIAISHQLIARLITDFPDTVIGIKDSSGKWDNLEQMVAAFPGFAVMTGADPLVARLLEIGGAGCITGGANAMPATLAALYRGYRAGAPVDALMEQVTALRNLSTSLPQVATLKALVAHTSGDDGWRRCRPPLMPLDDRDFARIGAEYDAIFAKT